MHFSYEKAMEEMHVIAYVYHWSRQEVRSLSVTERGAWCKQIIEQKQAENKQTNSEIEQIQSQSGIRR